MVAVGSVHNTRILRFLIVLIAVILTIFIYASYSTASTLTPQHMHVIPAPAPAAAALIGGQQSVASLVVLENQVSNDQGLNLSFIGTGSSSSSSNHHHHQQQPQQSQQQQQPLVRTQQHKTSAEAHINKKQHRVPTIDADALNDAGGVGVVGGLANSIDNNLMSNDIAVDVPDELTLGGQLVDANDQEEQYMQNVENLMGNINITADAAPKQQQQQQQQISQQQQQQQSDATDILIPTSNLQKFIENADKILKNMTNASSAIGALSAPATENKPILNEKESVILPEPPGLSQPEQTSNSNNIKNVNDDVNNSGPLPPSVIMKIVGAGNVAASGVDADDIANAPAPVVVPKANTKTTPPKAIVKKVGPIDPSKGIPTINIYENGHLDDEIDAERICPRKGSDIKLLILITSAMTHKDARLAIRQTWGHYGTRRDVSTAFILGRTTNETVNKALSEENFIYGDLIRGNFIDSYNNLTLKTLSSLEWVDRYCSYAKYILKTDDDMFINVPKLLSFLDRHKDKRVIYGRLAKKWKPIRNKKSKYYVSTDQFPPALFPAFTTGPAYVMTGDIVHDLYVRSLNTVYLKLEDVFTTGIVAQALSIKRVHVNEFLNRRISFNACNIRNAISVHMIKSNEQFDLWKKLLDQTTKCK